MRFFGRALIASAFVLGACAGKDNANADSGAAAAAPADTGAAAAAPAGGAAPAGAAGAAGAAQPISGTTHEVKMVFDGTNYKFEPADITIKAGDGIKWTMVSGGPHNVSFQESNPPADVASVLTANMPQASQQGTPKAGPLAGPMMMTANDTYTVSFAGVKPGKYEYNCQPHLAMNMKGTITVQ